ncbi:tyrosine--tRNA ligase [bacterium]|nr:tyrosine--tRNA ligase [bacterium]
MNKNIHPHTPGASVGVKELLTRGVQDIIGKEDLEKKLASGEKMKIYIGADPNRPDIHIGHAVALRTLKKFQDLGHQIIFLIGDFTAQIGDPSGKDEMRNQLTPAEVKKNALTYKKQISKILNFKGSNKAIIKYNSKWNKKLKFQDLIELSSNFTVQQFLERDMYQKRIKEGKPISLHEFFYPLMQAYDSVVMDVDMEVGGNDQLFNMLTGRTLMQKLKKKNKIVMTFEILEGTDGRKMSKSYDNYIGVSDEANNMFGKIMSIKDELIIKYFKLCTDLSLEEIGILEKKMKNGENPRNIKVKLAQEIVKIYHNEEKAKQAGEEFNKIFQKKDKPSDIETVNIEKDMTILEVITKFNLVSSNSDARRMIDQNAVSVNDQKIELRDYDFKLEKNKEYIIQVGKRRFLKIN